VPEDKGGKCLTCMMMMIEKSEPREHSFIIIIIPCAKRRAEPSRVTFHASRIGASPNRGDAHVVETGTPELPPETLLSLSQGLSVPTSVEVKPSRGEGGYRRGESVVGRERWLADQPSTQGKGRSSDGAESRQLLHQLFAQKTIISDKTCRWGLLNRRSTLVQTPDADPKIPESHTHLETLFTCLRSLGWSERESVAAAGASRLHGGE